MTPWKTTFGVGDEAKPKEAWTVVLMKPLRINFVQNLAKIGMFVYLRQHTVALKMFLSEKKVMPLTVLLAFLLYCGVAAFFYF